MRPHHVLTFALLAAALAGCGRTLPGEWDNPDAGHGDTPVETPSFTTCTYVGGLDRLVITAIWPQARQCMSVTFVAPGASSRFHDFAAPQGWALEGGWFGAAPCDHPRAHAPTLTDASGQLTFDQMNGSYWPALYSLTGTFSFAADGGSKTLEVEAHRQQVGAAVCP